MINHKIFPTADAVVKSLADDMLAYSQQGQPVHISLSGGSTPKMLFKLLASQPYANDIQWKNLHFWWGMNAVWHRMTQKATTVKPMRCCLANQHACTEHSPHSRVKTDATS